MMNCVICLICKSDSLAPGMPIRGWIGSFYHTLNGAGISDIVPLE